MPRIPAKRTNAGEIFIDDEYIKNQAEKTHIKGKIQKSVYEDLAKLFLPGIIAFTESESGKQYIEKHKKENNENYLS